MSRSGFPIFAGQPSLKIENFTITGANVGATQGTAGLDGRGANFCTIALSGSTYTVIFNVGLPDVPYVFFTPLTTDTFADALTFQTTNGTTTGFTFVANDRDDNTTGVTSACVFQVLVCAYGTVSFVS